MRVLLINPPETEQVTFNNPPLALLYLAGTLKKHKVNVRVVDGFFSGWHGVRDSIISFKPQIVGIPCLTPFRHCSYRIAKIAKKINPKTLVVFGGAHATIMHKQLIEHYPFIDVVVRGEGEKTFLEIAEGLKFEKIKGITYRRKKEAVINPPQEYFENLDEIPFPAWELVDLHRYPPLAVGEGVFNGIDLRKEPRISVVFSRGCPGSCNFCSTWWIWRKWRCRSGKNMADEIELLYKKYGIRHFCFADDCMTANSQKTIDFCQQIIKRKIKAAFNVTTRTDAVNLRLLRYLKEAGCYVINYGVESASPRILQLMNKKTSVEEAKRAIELTKKVGIKVSALMITGNVGETISTLNQSIRFLRKTKPDFVGTVGGLWVFPGTKLYYALKAKGEINDDFWLSKKPFMVYKGNFSALQLRYFRMALEKRMLINAANKPWYQPTFLLFYFLEKLAVKNRRIKKFLVRFYPLVDKIVKALVFK